MSDDRWPDDEDVMEDLHQVVLEELLQLLLGGRVREIPNVKSPTLSGTGNDGFILGSIDMIAVGLFDGGGGGHLGGNTFDRSGHCGLNVCG